MGRFFNSFGLTAAFAILVSLLVSFTLTPSLSARLLKPPSHGGEAHGRAGAASKQKGIYAALDKSYDWLLRWALGHRKTIVALTAVVVASTVAVVPYVKKEFIVERRHERVRGGHRDAARFLARAQRCDSPRK